MMQTYHPKQQICFYIIHSQQLVIIKLSTSCHLVVSNSNEYPEVHYEPTTDLTRVYRDVLKYVHENNEYGEGTLLNTIQFFFTLLNKNQILEMEQLKLNLNMNLVLQLIMIIVYIHSFHMNKKYN